MRAELRALVGIEAALEEITHDAGLDELPVGFAGNGELGDFFFGQFKDGGVFEEMTVEVANLVRAEGAAGRHLREEVFEDFGEMRGIIDAVLENLSNGMLREQAGVFGEEAKDDAIEEAGDAEVLALRDLELGVGTRVEQLDRFAFLK